MQAQLTELQMRESLDLLTKYGNASTAAAAIGMPVTTLRHRIQAAKIRLGIEVRRLEQHPARLGCHIENGMVIVFSDAHFWGDKTTAYRALLEAIKEFKPRIIINNGDAFDGASISRHPRIGWDNCPTVKEEITAVKEALDGIESIAGSSKLIWPLGNHDARFETFLAANSPQYEGVPGFTLKDHFPRWMPCWRTDINAGEDGHTIVKHKWGGGIHAVHGNSLKSGVNFVTGHLHSLKVAPYTDARGTRYGVDTGTLADPDGPQFVGYTEDGVKNWISGFAILTYRHGVLLPPELVSVIAPGTVAFRGKAYSV